ncbi:unnamed protein product [Cuscuta campestris]|uniref:Uncharacterized protein n=1 Tax=Cuscuta campestris TaxID=132261 RepID=A0A484KP86_9ASTE|nr:unnamed protein product [Cuscuta campestris]
MDRYDSKNSNGQRKDSNRASALIVERCRTDDRGEPKQFLEIEVRKAESLELSLRQRLQVEFAGSVAQLYAEVAGGVCRKCGATVYGQNISSSDAYASEESMTSSSSTGYYSSDFKPRSIPNPTVREPEPVNQMPGQDFMERDEPVDDEPAPNDPDNESYMEWEDRLEAAGYFPLPTSYVLDIYLRVSKIAQNKARRNLPVGYVLEYDPNWPNIIEPHREDRIDMNFKSFSIPKKTGASSSAGPCTSSTKTVPVQQETVEIVDEEEVPQTEEAAQPGKVLVNPPPHKGKGKTRTKQAATTHPTAKRKMGESASVVESLEELWVKMGRRLKEISEVGPDALEQLSEDSPSRSSQLEEKLKRFEAHNQELQDLMGRQLDEMANLSRMAGGGRG